MHVIINVYTLTISISSSSSFDEEFTVHFASLNTTAQTPPENVFPLGGQALYLLSIMYVCSRIFDNPCREASVAFYINVVCF